MWPKRSAPDFWLNILESYLSLFSPYKRFVFMVPITFLHGMRDTRDILYVPSVVIEHTDSVEVSLNTPGFLTL